MKTNINRVYSQLRYWGLTSNQYDFSTRWLGQCPSYFSSMKARDAEPGVSASLALLGRLRHFNEHLRASDTPRSNAQMGQLSQMLEREADTIAKQLFELSIQRVADRHSSLLEIPT